MALAGACLGFLWWNAAPAKIFMGDTGSLSIGSGLAALCLLMNLDLLLVIIGGLFVIVTLSVVIQVISFRVFHRRVFLMAPIHHHFELKGWPETTVIVRFWILAGLFAALGLGIFYGDFLSVGKSVTAARPHRGPGADGVRRPAADRRGWRHHRPTRARTSAPDGLGPAPIGGDMASGRRPTAPAVRTARCAGWPACPRPRPWPSWSPCSASSAWSWWDRPRR